MKLTSEQLKRFDEQGYLFFPNYFDAEETRILKASIPEVPTGDDEFVELDESGKPKVEAKPQRKAPPKKRGRVTKVRQKGRARPSDEAPSDGGDEEPEGE